VFTAQVLQFQDQLAAGPVDMEHPLTRRFVELPPAGFLPVPQKAALDRAELYDWLNGIFAGSVRWSPEVRCSADVAITAVQLAQHLNRIPLQNAVPPDFDASSQWSGGDPRPRVNILVPAIPADLLSMTTDFYPWLAFVREPRIGREGVRVRSSFTSTVGEATPQPERAEPASAHPAVPEAEAEPTAEPLVEPVALQAPALEGEVMPVRVIVAPIPRARYRRSAEAAFVEPPTAELSFVGVNLEDLPPAAVLEKIDSLGPHTMVDLFATTADPAREPLVSARAKAVASSLGLDSAQTPVGVYTRVLDGPDTLFLMVRKSR
jgi:hypothetical protein